MLLFTSLTRAPAPLSLFFSWCLMKKRRKIKQTRIRSLSNLLLLIWTAHFYSEYIFRVFSFLSWFRDTRLASKFVPLPSSLTRATAPLSPFYYYLKKLISKFTISWLVITIESFHFFNVADQSIFFDLKIYALNHN